MMKKVLIVSLCCVFLFSCNLVLAQQSQGQQGIHDAGTGITDSELKESNQGTGQGLDGQDPTPELYQGNGQGGQGVDDQSGQGSQMGSGTSEVRRSRVANAVQSMLEVAERNQGIGQQVRNIAQNQVQVQEQAEEALEKAQARKGFMKFLIGPDYSQLKTAEDRLEQHNQNLEELKVLRGDIEDDADAVLFDDQIKVMEDIKGELENAIEENSAGFSLFGWMNRMFNR